MLQELISKGFRVEEIRLILQTAAYRAFGLEAKINELELQSLSMEPDVQAPPDQAE